MLPMVRQDQIWQWAPKKNVAQLREIHDDRTIGEKNMMLIENLW